MAAEPETELQLRMSSITEILNGLYSLSFQIRSFSSKFKSQKAARYTEIDPDTHVDIFSSYAAVDRRHVDEVFAALRATAGNMSEPDLADDTFLRERLAAAITLRRRQFRYWQRHSLKLAASDYSPGDRTTRAAAASAELQQLANMVAAAEIEQQHTLGAPRLLPAAQSRAGESFLSPTEASAFTAKRKHDAVEAESIISYATTAVDLEGRNVELPPPPKEAQRAAAFVCPYCNVLCPAKHGRGRGWRAHVMHDLRPYVCTYAACPDAGRLYGSRRQWLEHEGLVHRRLWQCPQHPDATFGSESAFREHLGALHSSLTDSQVSAMVDMSTTYEADPRKTCIVCRVEIAATDSLSLHMSHHLERIAIFALPRHANNALDDQATGSQVGHGSVTERLLPSEESAAGTTTPQPAPPFKRVPLSAILAPSDPYDVRPGEEPNESQRPSALPMPTASYVGKNQGSLPSYGGDTMMPSNYQVFQHLIRGLSLLMTF
jgi:hypothetical protein